ncbi:MAG TPA: xanthine dehydrogenase family protein subunit M [Candidatus Lustribacter sp.]
MSFDLVEPGTLEEAVGLLDPDDAAVRAIAGGTALSLMVQSHIFKPTRLVSLRRLDGALRGVHVEPDGSLRIGALTTLTELERSPVLAISEPTLSRALHTLSNVRVRNIATVGGHLAHGDPHMDLPPILVTLGARVRAVSPRGERWIDVADLITGYYETSLAGDELIAELRLPVQPPGTRSAYEKFTALSADDWPAVGVAVWLRRDGETIAEARIAVGGATDRPTRMTTAEAALAGGASDAARFAAAADAAAGEVRPLGDLRGSGPYKREMVRVHVRRALQSACAPVEER